MIQDVANIGSQVQSDLEVTGKPHSTYFFLSCGATDQLKPRPPPFGGF
jgi:hypothetical protein